MVNTAGTLDYINDSIVSNRQAEATDVALSQATGEISNPIARDILPSVDLDDLGQTDWPGDVDEFIQTPASSTTAGEGVPVYEIDSDNGRQDDRVLAIYGFEAVAGADNVTSILFRGSDGQVFERTQLQGLNSDGDVPVDRQTVLRSPVLFDTQDNGEIEFVFDGDASSEGNGPVEIVLLGVSVEKRGRTIGNRS